MGPMVLLLEESLLIIPGLSRSMMLLPGLLTPRDGGVTEYSKHLGRHRKPNCLLSFGFRGSWPLCLSLTYLLKMSVDPAGACLRCTLRGVKERSLMLTFKVVIPGQWG